MEIFEDQQATAIASDDPQQANHGLAQDEEGLVRAGVTRHVGLPVRH
jgi:hypothetical protein